MPEEASAEAAKFLHRVSGKELQTWPRPSFLMDGPRQRQELLQVICNHMGRRLGRVHDAHMRRRNAVQQRLQQRIMSAAQHKSVRIVEAVAETLPKINPSDLFPTPSPHP